MASPDSYDPWQQTNAKHVIMTSLQNVAKEKLISSFKLNLQRWRPSFLSSKVTCISSANFSAVIVFVTTHLDLVPTWIVKLRKENKNGQVMEKPASEQGTFQIKDNFFCKAVWSWFIYFSHPHQSVKAPGFHGRRYRWPRAHLV